MKVAFYCFSAIASFAGVMLLSQLAIAYPAIRIGVSAVLFSGCAIALVAMAIASFVAMRKTKGTRAVSKIDLLMLLMPPLGLALLLGIAIALGGLAT